MPKLKNPKHELLAKNIVKEKFNLTKAYQKSYPDSSYQAAGANVHRVIENDRQIISRVAEIANAKGLTLEFELESLKDIHSANKPIVINGEAIDYPDNAVRLEAIKTGLKLHGALGADNVTNVDARSVDVSLDTKDIARLGDIVDKMKALRSKTG